MAVRPATIVSFWIFKKLVLSIHHDYSCLTVVCCFYFTTSWLLVTISTPHWGGLLNHTHYLFLSLCRPGCWNASVEAFSMPGCSRSFYRLRGEGKKNQIWSKIFLSAMLLWQFKGDILVCHGGQDSILHSSLLIISSELETLKPLIWSGTGFVMYLKIKFHQLPLKILNTYQIIICQNSELLNIIFHIDF